MGLHRHDRLAPAGNSSMNAPPPARILLCACAAHCATVLRAAAAGAVPLHGLLPTCRWPLAPSLAGSKPNASTPPSSTTSAWLVLWAVLPHPNAAQQALEQRWRDQLLVQPPDTPAAQPLAVQMLYGSALQQAQQLAPWICIPGDASAPSTNNGSLGDADGDCQECLDAHSEHQLFAHLQLRRTLAM